jgi:hypothetical protein
MSHQAIEKKNMYTTCPRVSSQHAAATIFLYASSAGRPTSTKYMNQSSLQVTGDMDPSEFPMRRRSAPGQLPTSQCMYISGLHINVLI